MTTHTTPMRQKNWQIITFRLNQERFAVDVLHIREIVRDLTIWQLPTPAGSIIGMVSLRHQVIPIINLKIHLNSDHLAYGERAPIVVIQHHGDTLGLLVDEVCEVHRVDASHLESAPDNLHDELVSEIFKINGHLLSYLKIAMLFRRHQAIVAELAASDTALQPREEADGDKGPVEIQQYVSFNMAAERYALEIQHVQEINRMRAIVEVPRASDYVEGVMNLRGKIVPVINLRQRFRIERQGFDRQSRIIIVRTDIGQLGFIVDSVAQVISIADEAIKVPPPEIDTPEARFIAGIAEVDDRLIMILDLDEIIRKNNPSFE